MVDRVTALKQAVQEALEAISDSRERVIQIAESTLDEVKRLEQEYEQVRSECNTAIERVEKCEEESRVARERLMIVNRDVAKYSEKDMKSAYDKAQQLQMELGQWREREVQLRFRRDDVARRLKALRVTAQQAEVLMTKFTHATQYLSTEFGDIASVLQAAQTQAILGLQMLQLLEEERRWLAERLHDGPMQSLASIGMRVQATAQEQSSDLRNRLNGVIGDLRQVVFDLRPPLLDDLGLVPTLKRYAQHWAEVQGITVKIHLVGLEISLTPTEKITVFRGVQEALKNAGEHSGATQVDITLLYAPSELQVTIADNGTGLGETSWMDWLDHGKLGLTLSRQRMSILGGDLLLHSNEPRGVKVVLTLPIERTDVKVRS